MAVLWLQFREPAQSLDDVIGLSRRTVIRLREKVIAASIGGIQIRSPQKRFDCIVVISTRVESHAQPDRKPRGLGIALRGFAKDFYGGIQRAMEKQFAGPVKEI